MFTDLAQGVSVKKGGPSVQTGSKVSAEGAW